MKYGITIGDVTIGDKAKIEGVEIAVEYDVQEVKHIWDRVLPLVKELGILAKDVLKEKAASDAFYASTRADEAEKAHQRELVKMSHAAALAEASAKAHHERTKA